MKHIFITLLYIIVAVSPIVAQSGDSVSGQSEGVPQVNITEDSSVEGADVASKGEVEKTPQELWEIANNAYINNNFSKAIKFYKKIEALDLVSLPLYYNLGNSYFKKGAIAKSLLYYYRALQLDPSDADTKHNIEVAQAETKDKIEAIPKFILAEWSEVVSSSLPIMGWSIISLLAWGGILTFLIIFILSKQLQRRKLGFYGLMACVVVMFISTSYAIGEREEIVNNKEAIVMSQSLSVKSSPTSTSTDLFVLHAGTKVGVKSSLEGWSKIVIADGREGWVESKRLEVI